MEIGGFAMPVDMIGRPRVLEILVDIVVSTRKLYVVILIRMWWIKDWGRNACGEIRWS